MPRFGRNETLGDLIAAGTSITAYCQAQRCERPMLDLDIYDLAMLFGTRARYINVRWPLRCSACGSNDITYRIGPETLNADTAQRSPPSNFRQSRTEQERIALKIVFPRRWG